MNDITHEFDQSLSWAGHLVADCICGRTHFATGQKAPDFEQDQLKQLRENAAAKPDLCIEHESTDFISAAHVNGTPFVKDCPCNRLENMEAFIWRNRTMIVNYIKARTAKEKAEKDAEFENLNEL